MLETEGIYLSPSERSPEAIAARFDEISDKSTLHEYMDGGGEFRKFLSKAAADAGIELGR